MPAQGKAQQILDGYRQNIHGRYFLGREFKEFEVPDLNRIQVDSYKSFLQEGETVEGRANKGLQNLFQSTFPFTSNDGKVKLEFDHYVIGDLKYNAEEAMEKDRSYVLPIKATIRLILQETGEIKEQEIFVCDLPYMSDEGTFIINGAVRVVVSQIHRSPGVVFDYNERASMYHSRLIPERGPWLEFEVVKDIMYIRIDRKQKFPATTLLKALGYVKHENIIKMFYPVEKLQLEKDVEAMAEQVSGRVVVNDILLPEEMRQEEKPTKRKTKAKAKEKTTQFICQSGETLTEAHAELLNQAGIKELEFVIPDSIEENAIILNTLEKDRIETQSDACIALYTIVRGTNPSNAEVARNEIIRRWKSSVNEEIIEQYKQPEPREDGEEFTQVDKSIFFNDAIYSLGSVGRYKINKRYNYEDADDSQVLSERDIIATMRHLIKVRTGEASIDDIDHLGNRRVRSVGEQLVNHLKICFARMERLAKERMTIQDHDTLTPQNLISIKPITAGIKEFFGTSQLSQFMDQTNPLSATTHKRRLNALGPGGLTRERAGFEVRDIHYTHYGRICPIETPEGPNIGLIVSLAAYSRINDYGFIETPYFEIKEGKLTGEIKYLSAIEEDRFVMTPFNQDIVVNKYKMDEMIPCRDRGDYPLIPLKEINFMDVAPSQIVSISSSLIPFLEHDDANRALMGSNMQRQAVPLLFPSSPIVGTGIEESVAKYSGFVVRAKASGKVTLVDNAKVEVTDKSGEIFEHKLKKALRTNQDTFYNQRPIIKEGDKVKEGDVICDGPSVDNGELALGKNVLVAFMTWEGYNYEDAILMSEKLVKEDVYTSIHIEELEVEARETKLGKEQVTRDIPNISEDDYKELDDDGIIQIGARVKPGSILVGKVTPKGQTEITPEYKLLHSIFGEKARDVKDTSLRVPHGTEGIVISVKRYTRDNRDDLKPGVIERVKIYLAKKRKLKEGDKFAGRHGNKGVVARVMPEEDMPYLPSGQSVQVVLNPLGVPSRMNIGQVYEMALGWAGLELGSTFASPVFNGVSLSEIERILEQSGLPEHGKSTLYDGRTGEAFINEVTVGIMYYLKLAHLADDKIHARSTGPYSLVTQQPLGGKAQFGGQRVGEMEVWAVEAYGAANVLQEFLTVKSDAMEGRTRIYESIIKGDYVSTPGIPESFNVLVQELRGLGLNIEIFDSNNDEISITPRRKEKDKRKNLI